MLKHTSLLLFGLTLAASVARAEDALPQEDSPSSTHSTTDRLPTSQPPNPAEISAAASAEPEASGASEYESAPSARDIDRMSNADERRIRTAETPQRDVTPHEPQLPVSTTHVDDELGTIDGDDRNGRLDEGKFRILLQLRYRHTNADRSMLSDQGELEREQRGTLTAQDGYDIQRAFLRHTSRPSDELGTKLLVDFAELRHGQPRQSFKLAYLQIHATRRLELNVGLMKRTYSLLELLPIVNHELADLGPTDAFIKDEGYGGRDVGIIARYSPLSKRRWLTMSIGTFRGDIDEGYDANPLKLVTARVESFPWKHLRLGACGSYRPERSVEMQRLTNPDTGTKYYAEVTTRDPGKAFGFDATLLFKHLQLRTEALYGNRTNPERLGSDHFVAGYVVLASTLRLGTLAFVPAGKLERLDLNPESSGGARTLVTAVVGVVPLEGLRVLGDLTYTRVDRGLTFMERVPWTSAKNPVYAIEPSSTAVTVQVQYHH